MHACVCVLGGDVVRGNSEIRRVANEVECVWVFLIIFLHYTVFVLGSV